MSECEEAEEGVHPAETPLCGQHDIQTEAGESPEQQRPDFPGLSVPVESNRSTDSPRLYNIRTIPETSIREESTSSVSSKSDRSKDDIINFKERQSSLKLDYMSSSEEEDVAEDDSPEQQRPDSPGLSIPVESNWLTDSPGLYDISNITGLNYVPSSSEEEDVLADDGDSDPTSIREESTSSVSFKSDRSKDDINFKERRSSLKVPLESPRSSESRRVSIQSDNSQGHIENVKENHSSPKRKLRDRVRTFLRRYFRGQHSDM